MRQLHKLFALVLSLALVVSCISLPARAAGETSEVAGNYASGSMELALDADGNFSLTGALDGELTGTFTYKKVSAFWGTSVTVTLDETSVQSLRNGGVVPWYGDGTITLGWVKESDTPDGSFSIAKDVSKALVSNDVISAETVANPSSPTGYTTTFTVADSGYDNMYAYGDWVAGYKDDLGDNGHTPYEPESWVNGMNYYTSSVRKMVKDEETGNWTLTLNLASSVMGIACYHDVNEADLVGLFPQKKSFYIPYDAEKQSESIDWTPAFPASETGSNAGTVTAVTTTGGVKLDVYTPYGYSADETYPVMYLIAGGGSTYESWFTQGMVGNIFDNLIEAGKVEPTVLVAMEFQAVGGTQLQEDVIPYIEENYSVYTDVAHRALTGVSMGSATATNIWLADPELFSYYAFLSGANKEVFGTLSEDVQPSEEIVAKMAQANYFIGGGTTDFNMFEGDQQSASITQLDTWMDNHGIAHNTKGDGDYDIAMGDHNWPIWMQLMIPYATNYLWQDNGNGDDDGNTEEGALELKVESNILGLADTGNKSTLKETLINTGGPGDTALYYYNEAGQRVKYEDQNETHEMEPVKYQGSATLDLGDNVDDRLIDSSNATVKLVDGNGYYAEELIFNGSSKLDGTWSNGKYTYTLPEIGALEWNNWDYYADMSDDEIDSNSGREWSMMGGDGNGVYYFTLEVSGITYDGKEVPAAKIPVTVYIYGRSSADLGLGTEFVENTYDANYTSGLTQDSEVQWKWYSENEEAYEPFMNDLYSDYFSVVWPAGTDASGITADNVKVTLRSAYGDEYVLSTETAYGEHEYAVVANGGETEVIVTYQQWAYIPAYCEMEISIESGDLKASETFTISSVGTYLVQTGGGGVTVDHTVTAYNHYGISGMTLDNAVNKYYTLSVKLEDGTTKYYAEDENGNAYLADAVEVPNPWGFGTTAGAPDEAMKFDGTEKYHLAVCNNVVYVETRLDNTQVKMVDGVEYTFTENISATISDAEIIANGASLEPGYNLVTNGADKWAWTFRYQSGWTTDSDKPDSLPYAEGAYPYGFSADSAEADRPYYGMEIPSGPSGPGGPSGPDGPGGPGGDTGNPDPDKPGSGDTNNPNPDQPGTDQPTVDGGNNKTDQSGNGVQKTDTSNTTKSDTPRTGDSSNTIIWIICLVAAAGAVCGCVIVRRKKRS